MRQTDDRANEILGAVHLVLPTRNDEVEDSRVGALSHVDLGSRDRLDHPVDLGLVDCRELLLADGDRLSVKELSSIGVSQSIRQGHGQVLLRHVQASVPSSNVQPTVSSGHGLIPQELMRLQAESSKAVHET